MEDYKSRTLKLTEWILALIFSFPIPDFFHHVLLRKEVTITTEKSSKMILLATDGRHL